jgi:hypothetical protein
MMTIAEIGIFEQEFARFFEAYFFRRGIASPQRVRDAMDWGVYLLSQYDLEEGAARIDEYLREQL